MKAYIVESEKYSHRGWRKRMAMGAFTTLQEAEKWLNNIIIGICEEGYGYKNVEDCDDSWEDEDGNIRYIIPENYEPGFIFWYDDRKNELYVIEEYEQKAAKPQEWEKTINQIQEFEK